VAFGGYPGDLLSCAYFGTGETTHFRFNRLWIVLAFGRKLSKIAWYDSRYPLLNLITNPCMKIHTTDLVDRFRHVAAYE